MKNITRFVSILLCLLFVVVHGVAMKPGKPVILAVVGGLIVVASEGRLITLCTLSGTGIVLYSQTGMALDGVFSMDAGGGYSVSVFLRIGSFLRILYRKPVCHGTGLRPDEFPVSACRLAD